MALQALDIKRIGAGEFSAYFFNPAAGIGMELIGVQRNPIPPGAAVGKLSGHDGIALRFALWESTAATRKGTVCVFGGRGEYIEKYFETIDDLRHRGFFVATMDWRGQGGSARLLRNPRKGHVESFTDYDKDLAIFMREIVLPDCPPPYFALAHSMGGTILLRAACLKDCWFDRMVLVAPMLRIVDLPFSEPLTSKLAEIAMFFGLGDAYIPGGNGKATDQKAFAGNVLTSDEIRFNRNKSVLDAAPELGIGSPTIGWLHAAFDSIELMGGIEFPTNVHTPALMLAAGSDKVVDSRAIEDLAMQLKAGAQIVIDGPRHEILQERNVLREQVWAAFDAFVPGGGA